MNFIFIRHAENFVGRKNLFSWKDFTFHIVVYSASYRGFTMSSNHVR